VGGAAPIPLLCPMSGIPPVVVTLDIDPGNTKSGATGWAKRLSTLNLEAAAKGGYAFEGPFLSSAFDNRRRPTFNYAFSGEAGDLIVACGKGGSRTNRTDLYRLRRPESPAVQGRDEGPPG